MHRVDAIPLLRTYQSVKSDYMEIFLSLLRGDKRIVHVTFGLFKILSKLQFVYSCLRPNTTCLEVQINHKYINLRFTYIGSLKYFLKILPGLLMIRYSGLFSNEVAIT